MRKSLIQERIALLKRNIRWLEEFLSAKTLDLYASRLWVRLSENHPFHEHACQHKHDEAGRAVIGDVCVLGYYSLIGLNGDPEMVIPTPVLLKLLTSDGTPWEQTARGFLQRDLSTRELRLRQTHIDARRCAVGKHDPSLNGECGWCYGVGEAHWVDPENPVKIPIKFSPMKEVFFEDPFQNGDHRPFHYIWG